jgi:peptidoglycan-binding protein ArfA
MAGPSRLYRRPPGAAWLVALVAIPLLLAMIGWAGLRTPDADVGLSRPSVNPSATLPAPSGNAADATAADTKFAPLSIALSPNGFTLFGEVPTVEAKKGLVDSLRLAFGPGLAVTDNVNVKSGVNAPDFAALGSILGAGVGISDFGFALNGGTVTLTGAAPTGQARSEVESAVKAVWPKMAVVNDIAVK